MSTCSSADRQKFLQQNRQDENFHEFQHRKYPRKLNNNNIKNNSIILVGITFTAVTFNKLTTEDSA